MTVTVSTVLSILIVFGLLYLIFYLAGRFGSPTAQRITGIICLVVFVIFALSRLGVLDTGGSIRL